MASYPVGMRRLGPLVIVLALLGVLVLPAGAAAAAGDPLGSLDEVSVRDRGGWQIEGWAGDPDAGSAPVEVHLYVDGRFATKVTTGGSRPDVARVHPDLGTRTGYTAVVTANYGFRVCAYAINQGPGSTNTTLGCRTLSSRSVGGDPRGHLDETAVPPGQHEVRLRGWAGDPDGGAATVKILAPGTECRSTNPPSPCNPPYLIGDGHVLYAATDAGRPDVAAAYPGLPSNSGFDVTLDVPDRSVRSLCLYALNQGRTGNNNTFLGCVDVTAASGPQPQPAGAPFGSFDESTYSEPYRQGQATLRGTAGDPDATGPVVVRIRQAVAVAEYVESSGSRYATPVRRDRVIVTDVVADGPAVGGARRWEANLAVPAGHVGVEVCAWVLNQNAGAAAEQWIGCR